MDIKSLHEKLDSNPLWVIDDIIINLLQYKEEDVDKVLIIFAEAIIRYKKIGTAAENPLEEIFRSDLEYKCQEFIALCLLRLMATEILVLDNNKERNNFCIITATINFD